MRLYKYQLVESNSQKKEQLRQGGAKNCGSVSRIKLTNDSYDGEGVNNCGS